MGGSSEVTRTTKDQIDQGQSSTVVIQSLRLLVASGGEWSKDDVDTDM